MALGVKCNPLVTENNKLKETPDMLRTEFRISQASNKQNEKTETTVEERKDLKKTSEYWRYLVKIQ